MDYTIVIERGATCYGAYVLELLGCAAAAESEVEVRRLIHEAIVFHLEDVSDE